MYIHLLAGARPNYMKIFPVWEAIRRLKPDWNVEIIHTGQHYDALMSDIFFADLGMPPPHHFLGVGSGSHAVQTAKVMTGLDALFDAKVPDLLVVVGDVNSTMAGTLVAVKRGIRVSHLEAGLRSGDRTMPEEINRIVTDVLADELLTSCRDAGENLAREGIAPEKVFFSGNVMIDSLMRLLPKANDSLILDQLGVTPKEYACITLHRPSNVDQPAHFINLIKALGCVAKTIPLVFPVHPRTKAMIDAATSVQIPKGMHLVPPLGYLDFLKLMSNAALVITDSGGIQEETTSLRIPCLTLRKNTERPVTITEGTNKLVDPAGINLQEEVRGALNRTDWPTTPVEGWDGHAAERIVSHWALQA